MTRLLALANDRRAKGIEPSVVHLSNDDERALQDGAAVAFGSVGVAAAARGAEAFRAFVREWMRASVELDTQFDADETDVS